MGDEHHDGMPAAVEVCLGVFTAVGTAIAAAGVALLALGRLRPTAMLEPAGARAGAAVTRALEARADPPPCSLFCVWRR